MNVLKRNIFHGRKSSFGWVAMFFCIFMAKVDAIAAWSWPDTSFESSGWTYSRWAGTGTGGYSTTEYNSGAKSLYIQSNEITANAVLKSPYIAATPYDLGCPGTNTVSIVCYIKLKADSLDLPTVNGGPSISLVYYDQNKTQLYQDIIGYGNANQDSPAIGNGSTNGWVIMQGTSPRVIGSAAVAYVQVWLQLKGGGTIYFDDISLKPFFPDPSFESSGWTYSRWAGTGAGGYSTAEHKSGAKSLYIQSNEITANAVLKSPYIEATPADLGAYATATRMIATSVKIKTQDVTFQENVYGGPSISLVYYDQNKTLLYQDVIINQNQSGPIIAGTTDWVTMRGILPRVMGTQPIKYIQVWLQLKGGGKIYFDDLVMKPEADLTSAERAEFYYMEPMPAPVNPIPPTPLPQSTARGFVGFNLDLITTILPNYSPLASNCGDSNLEVNLKAAQGETTSVSFGVFGLDDPTVHITCQYTGNTLPSSWLTWYTVRCWTQNTTTVPTRGTVVPELLDPLAAFDLPLHNSKQLWATVRVPSDAAPGVYSGIMTLTAGGNNYQVNVNLTVRPFALTQNDVVLQQMYYTTTSHVLYTGIPTLSMIKAEFADMLDHGINAVYTSVYPYVNYDASQEGHVAFNFSRMNTLLSASTQTGMHTAFSSGKSFPLGLSFQCFDDLILSGGQGYYSGKWVSGFDTTYKRGINEMASWLSTNGIPKIMLGLEDEPGNFPSIQPEVGYSLAAITGTTGFPCGQVQSMVNPGTVTVPPNGWLWSAGIASNICNMRFYTITQSYLNALTRSYTACAMSVYEGNFPDKRYKGGLYAYSIYKAGGLGVSWYTYQTGTNPYAEGTTMMSKSEMTTYPDQTTLVPKPTLQWEMVRIGINDLRYMLTLDQKQTEKCPGEPLNTQINNFRANLLNTYTPLTSVPGPTAWSTFEMIRDQISDYIAQLDAL